MYYALPRWVKDCPEMTLRYTNAPEEEVDISITIGAPMNHQELECA